MIRAAILAIACVPLAGCLTAAGRAAIPNPKPIEIGIQSDLACSDIGKAALAAGGEPAIGGPQLMAIYEACEKMQASQRVIVDIKAARDAGLRAPLP